MKNILASWKTTLVGVAGVAITALSASQHASIGAAVKDPAVQISLLVGLLGLFAKDGNVTGGTKGQPSTAAALVASNQAISVLNPPAPVPVVNVPVDTKM